MIIQLVVLIALIGYAFNSYTTPEDEMIFDFYGRWLKKFAGKGKWQRYIAKPLGLCIVCNTAWIGILFCWLCCHLEWWLVLAIAIAASGLAKLIKFMSVYIFNRLNP